MYKFLATFPIKKELLEQFIATMFNNMKVENAEIRLTIYEFLTEIIEKYKIQTFKKF